jgi:hypothetical protein
MDTLIRMHAEEMNADFIDYIKSTFKGKKIALHVYEEHDETEYLLQSVVNEERLYQSIENIKNNISLKEMDYSELQEIINLDSK